MHPLVLQVLVERLPGECLSRVFDGVHHCLPEEPCQPGVLVAQAGGRRV